MLWEVEKNLLEGKKGVYSRNVIPYFQKGLMIFQNDRKNRYLENVKINIEP